MRTPVCDFCGAAYTPHTPECRDFGKEPPALAVSSSAVAPKPSRIPGKQASLKTLQTILEFERVISPQAYTDVHLSSARVMHDDGWVTVPVADVGIFKAQKMTTACTELFLVRVEIEVTQASQGATRPGKYNQLQYEMAIEAFHRNGALSGGVVMDVCFPEHMTLVVANRTDMARRFSMEVHG